MVIGFVIMLGVPEGTDPDEEAGLEGLGALCLQRYRPQPHRPSVSD